MMMNMKQTISLVEKDSVENVGYYTFREHDFMGFENFAKNITCNLIDKCSSSTVISISSCWGTGKTRLAKMWTNELQNDSFGENLKIKPVYYSAWNSDDWTDAFSPLVSTITSYYRTLFKTNELKNKAMKNTLSSVLNLAGDIVGGIIESKTGIKKKEIEKIIEVIKGEKRELDQSIEYDTQFEKHNKKKQDFRDDLEKLIELDQNHDKVIVFIDELDRCKPPFAIETLETVKHLFNIPNLHFVFLLDTTQLERCVEQVYGKVNGNLYLNKFFDFKFSIPELNPSNQLNFFKNLLEKSSLDFSGVRDGYVEHLIDQTLRFSLTPRQLVIILNATSSVFAFDFSFNVNKDNENVFLLFFILMIIKYYQTDIYENQLQHKNENVMFEKDYIYFNSPSNQDIKFFDKDYKLKVLERRINVIEILNMVDVLDNGLFGYKNSIFHTPSLDYLLRNCFGVDGEIVQELKDNNLNLLDYICRKVNANEIYVKEELKKQQ